MLLLVVVVIWFDCCFFYFVKLKNAQTRKKVIQMKNKTVKTTYPCDFELSKYEDADELCIECEYNYGFCPKLAGSNYTTVYEAMY